MDRRSERSILRFALYTAVLTQFEFGGRDVASGLSSVLRRRLHGRVRLTNNDRWFFIQLYRWFPFILQVLTIIRPETLVRWHRAG